MSACLSVVTMNGVPDEPDCQYLLTMNAEHANVVKTVPSKYGTISGCEKENDKSVSSNDDTFGSFDDDKKADANADNTVIDNIVIDSDNNDFGTNVVNKVDGIEITIEKSTKNKPELPTKNAPPSNLPFELLSIGPHHIDYIQCGNEANHKEKDPKRRYTEHLVAKTITLVDNNGEIEYVQDLDALTAKQLRWVATQMGCRNVGSTNKYFIRQLMAKAKHTITQYNNNNKNMSRGINPLISNNYLRVINAVMLNDVNFTKFMLINDKKSRHYFEVGNGPKEVYFWNQVASLCNDPDAELIGEFMTPSTNLVDYNNYLDDAKLEDMSPAFNESGFCEKDCNKMITNLIKIRAKMVLDMTTSGTHDSDPWAFTKNAINHHSLVRTVHQFVAYFFFIACKERKGIDFVLTRYLAVNLRIDTTTPMKSRTESTESSGSRNKKKNDEALERLMKKVDESNDLLRNHLAKSEDTQQFDRMKLYADMLVMIEQSPFLKDNPIISKRMKKLEEEADREDNNFIIKKPRLNSNESSTIRDDDDESDITESPFI